jgi:hypothetical protein
MRTIVRDIPMPVLPACVLLDSNLDCESKLALLDLAASVLASLDATAGAGIRRSL